MLARPTDRGGQPRAGRERWSCHGPRRGERRAGHTRRRGPASAPWVLRPTFPYWLRKLDADVIVVHEPNPIALVAHALSLPGARWVFWIHAEVVRPAWRYKLFYRPFLWRMLKLADRIVVASPQVAQLASELQPFQSKCLVIPYALDPDQHAS